VHLGELGFLTEVVEREAMPMLAASSPATTSSIGA